MQMGGGVGLFGWEKTYPNERVVNVDLPGLKSSAFQVQGDGLSAITDTKLLKQVANVILDGVG